MACVDLRVHPAVPTYWPTLRACPCPRARMARATRQTDMVTCYVKCDRARYNTTTTRTTNSASFTSSAWPATPCKPSRERLQHLNDVRPMIIAGGLAGAQPARSAPHGALPVLNAAGVARCAWKTVVMSTACSAYHVCASRSKCGLGTSDFIESRPPLPAAQSLS